MTYRMAPCIEPAMTRNLGNFHSGSVLRMPARIVVLLLSCALIADAFCKSALVSFSNEFMAEHWGLDEGYPENSCSGIAIAPDGYLWLGTFRGLVRYNGHRFSHWAPDALPELARTSITSMFSDRSGRIWFSTYEGLILFDGQTWRQWKDNDGWADRSDLVRTYAEAPDGRLAFGRFSGRIMEWTGRDFRELPTPPGTGGALCAYDGEGTLHAARQGDCVFYRDNSWSQLNATDRLPQKIAGIGQNRDGHVLLFTETHMLRLRGGGIVSRVALSQPIGTFWQLTQAKNGALWLPAIASGVFRVEPDGTTKFYGKREGLVHSSGTRVVFADESDTLWIGSGVGGLTNFRPRRFQYVGEGEGLADKVVLTLAPLRDGRVLLTTYGSGPAYFDGQRATFLAPAGSETASFIRTALRTKNDDVWLGTFGKGLMKLADNRIEPVRGMDFGIEESIDTMFEDSRQRLWVGSERRAGFIQDGRFTPAAFGEPLDRKRPTLFAEKRDGTVLLTKHNQIYAFDARGLQGVPLITLPDAWRISTLLVDKDDRIWIGTNGYGLHVLRDGRLSSIPAEAGLPAPTITSLIQDRAGKLWFGSGRNIVCAEPEDLWRSVLLRQPLETLRLFGPSDGLQDLDLPYGTQPCVAQDDEGHLWFALIRGAAMIDPSRLVYNEKPPRVVVEAISYRPRGSDSPVEIGLGHSSPPPRLPAGSRMIKIDYAALEFTSTNKQLFRVRLGGSEGHWQEMQRETSVSFFELPPGQHTLEIQARGGDGAWNRTGARLQFELDAFFWQTTWFRIAAIVAILFMASGLTWFAVYLRLRIFREKYERERRFSEEKEALRCLAIKLTESLQPAMLGRAVADSSRILCAHDAFLLVMRKTANEEGECVYLEDTPEGATAPTMIAPEASCLNAFTLRSGDGGPSLLIREAGRPLPDKQAYADWGAPGQRAFHQMSAPVMWNGQIAGLLTVRCYSPKKYSQKDLELLQTLAAHCGAAVARLQTEELLQRNEAQLRQSQKLEAIGTLAGGIAHDFNNILTAIIGNVELARSDIEADHPIQEYLNAINQSGLRARDLVRRILAFSRPRDSRRQPALLIPVIEEVLQLLRATTPAAVSLKLNTSEDLPEVEVDAMDVHQVLVNLGTNAVHAIGKGAGQVIFDVQLCSICHGVQSPSPELAPGNYVRIDVSDNGSGIPPEILSRIFDPFFTTKRTGEGTGLGLSVVHGIMRANDGAITVRSTPERGSTFSVYFPAKTSAKPSASVVSVSSAQAKEGKGQRILYVDDETSILQVLERLFVRAGYSIECTQSATKALDTLRTRPGDFELLITDYSMPEINGIELARAARSIAPNLPIVLSTGYEQPGVTDEAMRLGRLWILNKADSRERLLPLVAKILSEGRAARS